MMLKAAVIGLGNIGFQFNLDPKRKETWSHVSAYGKCEKTKLAGAVETDDAKIALFKKHYDAVPVFKNVRKLMKDIGPDIVSICTPTRSHYGLVRELLRYPVKAIFCEKPIAATMGEAKKMVRSCEAKNVILAINHVRRWEGSYVAAAQLVQGGGIGDVKSAEAFYPGQIFNIGTHLLDTVRMIIGKEPESASGISFDPGHPDPGVSGWIRFSGDILCAVNATGKREDLIFEIDIIGSDGRLRISGNGEKLERFSFAESRRYSGYRELKSTGTDTVPINDRFVEAIHDIVRVVEGKKAAVNCTGRDALYALAMSYAMLGSARKNGRPVKVDVGKREILLKQEIEVKRV